MEQILEYIRPELLVLIPVLYFVGAGLKKAMYFEDKHIPLVLGLLSILLCLLYVMATSALGGWKDVLLSVFTAITQGVLCAGCSVYINQIIKQETEK